MKLGTPSLLVVAALLVGGCSDDLTCPELDPADVLPYISARVVQNADDRLGSTHAEVVCTADPLPSLLVAFVNGRELPDAGTTGDLSAVATLDDDVVVWQSGTRCSLEVTTNYGFATAGGFVPDAVVAVAPTEILLGDSLVVTWEKAAGADYYELSGTLAAGSGVLVSSGRDTVVLSATTRDTFVVFAPDVISFEGVAAGVVTAVTGPFPESGAEGNISGDGWGFFTLRFTDPGSSFSVTVAGARNE